MQSSVQTRVAAIRATVLEQIRIVAVQQHKKLGAFHDDMPLLESGLDSLCIAVLVARLEDELGLDPFGSDDGESVPVTLGDFIAVYESAAA